MGNKQTKSQPQELVDLPPEYMQSSKQMQFLQHFLIVQCCVDCSKHYSYTRHIEEKYIERLDGIRALLTNDPETQTVIVLKNKIPKQFDVNEPPHDIKNYGQIVENNNERYPLYDLKPTLSSFEVTFNGHLLWSKLEHKSFPDPTDIYVRLKKIL